MISRFLPALRVAALLSLAVPALQAEVRLPSILSDHMVLQSGVPVANWGWARPGEEVTVSFGKQSKSATPGADGKWRVQLEALPPSREPQVLTVRGTNAVTIHDVLVGEVWLCSGQSNMAMQVDGLHGTVDQAAEEIAAARYPEIRQFAFDQVYDIYKLEVPPRKPEDDRPGHWVVCSPETVAHFSAIGYFAGRELHQRLSRPVGMVLSAVGGTPIEAWTSRSAQEAQPDLSPVLEAWDKEMTGYNPAAEQEKDEAAKKAWLAERAVAMRENRPVPKAPLRFKNRQVMEPGGLFNAHIHPLIPYTVRGVLWYQGERNAAGPLTRFYGRQLETLIGDWRSRWGSEVYFAWVQLPNYLKPSPAPSQENGWGVWVREGQRQALALPRTGMAVTIDLGGEKAGHPTNKQAFGERLSRIIFHDVYGQDSPAWCGPLLVSAERRGREMVLSFRHAEGLMADGGELKGFAIAGPDQKFVWANARIEGEQVIVTANRVSEPAAVRYNWAANPSGNLRNGAGLPASPFRTDDW